MGAYSSITRAFPATIAGWWVMDSCQASISGQKLKVEKVLLVCLLDEAGCGRLNLLRMVRIIFFRAVFVELVAQGSNADPQHFCCMAAVAVHGA